MIIICIILMLGYSCKRKTPATIHTRTVVVTQQCTTFKEGLITTINCPDGTSSQIFDGVDGTNGVNAEQCYVEPINSGTNIICGSSIVTILDGVDGEDGADGTNSITEIIDPCGDNPGKFDEVLIRLENNQLLVYFEDAGNRFLSLLSPGNYRTTDSQKCYFTVDENYDIMDEHI